MNQTDPFSTAGGLSHCKIGRRSDLLRSVDVDDGKETEIGGGAYQVLHRAGEWGDVEAGRRRG
jgi:hypothetical protein